MKARKKINDDNGSIIIMAALFMTMIIGACAVAINISYSRLNSERTQSMVDALAMATAYDIKQYCNSQSCNTGQVQTDTNGELTKIGCKGDDGSSCRVIVTYPYNGDSDKVEVSLSRHQNNILFSNFGGDSNNNMDNATITILDITKILSQTN